MSGHQGPVSGNQVTRVRCRVTRVRCQIIRVRCQVTKVRCQVTKVRCQVTKVRCQVTRSPVSGVKSPGSGVRSPGSGVRSAGSGVRSPRSGVWSPGCGVRSPGVTRVRCRATDGRPAPACWAASRRGRRQTAGAPTAETSVGWRGKQCQQGRRADRNATEQQTTGKQWAALCNNTECDARHGRPNRRRSPLEQRTAYVAHREAE